MSMGSFVDCLPDVALEWWLLAVALFGRPCFDAFIFKIRQERQV